MPNTFEKRARDALEAKDDSFRPRGEKNRARFEEMKREMQTELASDVAQGKQSIRHAGNKAVRHITNAADVAEQKIEAAAAEAVAKAMKKRKFLPAAQETEETSNTTSSDPSTGLSETGVPAPTAELPSTLTPAAAAEPGDRGQGQSLPEQPAAAEPANRGQNVGEDLVLVPVGTEDPVHNTAMMLAHVPTTTLAHMPPAARAYHTAEPMPPADHAKLREDAVQAERDRLAPELAQKIRQAYQRLALQHGWPPLAEEVELPGDLKSRVAWFFKVNPAFKHALHTKWRHMARSAVTSTLSKQRETCSCCKHQQFLARDPFGYHFSEKGTTFVWDACAQHRALTVTEEASIETDVRAEWAEEAVNAAVCAWRQQLDAEAKARRDSLARQEEAEADSERVREVERQVRERLRPETRGCEMCLEADECIGGMCSLHESRFRALCMAVSCGSAAKPTPAPLGRMLPLQS